jgi:hypothetical protein
VAKLAISWCGRQIQSVALAGQAKTLLLQFGEYALPPCTPKRGRFRDHRICGSDS